MNNVYKKIFKSGQYIGLFICLSYAAITLAVEQDSKGLKAGEIWTLPVPADNTILVQVQNNGIDTIAKALTADGEVISQSASWRGQEGRYLLSLGGTQDTALKIQIESTEKHVSAGEVIISWLDINSMADKNTLKSLQAIAAASHQRVTHFLGGEDTREQIVEIYLSAVSQLHNTEYAHWAGDVYYEIGAIEYGFGRFDNATGYYSRALNTYQQYNNSRGVAAAYNELSNTASELGEYDLALEYLDTALKLRIAQEDIFYQAQVLNNIGSQERYKDNFGSAAKYLEQALVLFAGEPSFSAGQVIQFSAKKIGIGGDLAQVITTLSNLALAKTSMGSSLEAIDLWQAAIRLNKEINQPLIAARAEHNLGHALQELGRLDEALTHIDNAANVFEQKNDDSWFSRSLESIGAIYLAIDEFADATTYFEQALVLSSGNQQRRAKILRRLANVNWRTGEFKLADAQFTEAYDIFNTNKQSSSAAIVASEHGQLQYELGDSSKALVSQRAAFDTLSRLGYVREAARAQSRLGHILLQENDTQQAQQILQEALEGHRAVFDELYELDTLIALSRTQNGQASLDSAKAATELANQIRLRTLTPDLQSSFLASRRVAFEQYIDLLVDNGDIREAWVVSEQIRARSLLDLIQAEGMNDSDFDQVSNERDLLLAKLTDVSKVDNESQLVDLRREIDLLEGQLRGYQLTHINAAIDSAAIQEQLTDEVTMLSYFVGSQGSHLWTVTNQQVQHYPLPAADKIGPIANDLTNALRSHRQSRSRIAYIANQLSEMVLQPALDNIKGQDLVVIADGSLQLVPFGLLPIDTAYFYRHL